MFYNGDKSYYPLICVGQNIQFDRSNPDLAIKGLCVSPSGRVAIVEQVPALSIRSQRDFVAKVELYSHILKTMSCALLDNICEDYYYKKYGQAARVIDLMAKNGLLTFSEAYAFTNNVTRGLQKEPILVILSVPDGEFEETKQKLLPELFQDSQLLFALSQESVCSHFISI